ncbi:MAG TPA: aminopeptidase P family protein [Acidimicrobiales bacterium]|nr:aminopeptidase P family protein [Acidimicrobiales bacterium]
MAEAKGAEAKVAGTEMAETTQEAGLPAMEVAPRLGLVRERLEDAGCEALLVTSLVNVRYLSGFSGSAGLLLVLPDETVLVTDGRYKFQSAEQLNAADVEARIEVGNLSRQKEAMADAARGVRRLGLEAAHVSWARQRTFASEWFAEAELVPTEGIVEGLRRVKDQGEIARLALAARIADRALAAVRPRLREAPTEREVALELDYQMRRLGAEGPSFDTIVASGPNGAKPHASPSDRAVAEGELVVIDFGALVDGYHSDMTRTFCVGEPATSVLRRMVEVVTRSQAAGVAAVAVGRRCAEVDQACRDVIAEAGWAEAFLHSTGHGVGLDIHEAPTVAATSTDTLEDRAVVTVEPGVYLPEHGGVRIEDSVVVTDGGCRALTTSPKDLIVT